MGISSWFTQPFIALGTDGFGLSETRDDLRNHFEVDARYIAWAALTRLYREGALGLDTLQRARLELNIPKSKTNPASL
jgi:pyruvate dehydrogenase E1 component